MVKSVSGEVMFLAILHLGLLAFGSGKELTVERKHRNIYIKTCFLGLAWLSGKQQTADTGKGRVVKYGDINDIISILRSFSLQMDFALI